MRFITRRLRKSGVATEWIPVIADDLVFRYITTDVHVPQFILLMAINNAYIRNE